MFLDAVSSNGLFSQNIFKKYLIPKLLDIFCVRDAQIRQLLLNHFIHYMNCFTYDELQSQILPEVGTHFYLELLFYIMHINDDNYFLKFNNLNWMFPQKHVLIYYERY